MMFKMKYFGGAYGRKSSRYYSFDKGEIIEAESGEFDENEAEQVQPEEVKAKAEVGTKEAETASVKPQGQKRSKKRK